MKFNSFSEELNIKKNKYQRKLCEQFNVIGQTDSVISAHLVFFFFCLAFSDLVAFSFKYGKQHRRAKFTRKAQTRKKEYYVSSGSIAM